MMYEQVLEFSLRNFWRSAVFAICLLLAWLDHLERER